MPAQRDRTRPITWIGDGSKGDYNRKDTEINYSAKLTAQPFANLRVSASLVNNFWKYRGALPTIRRRRRPDGALVQFRIRFSELERQRLHGLHRRATT